MCWQISRQHLWPTCLLHLHGLWVRLLHRTAVHMCEDKRFLRGHHQPLPLRLHCCVVRHRLPPEDPPLRHLILLLLTWKPKDAVTKGAKQSCLPLNSDRDQEELQHQHASCKSDVESSGYFTGLPIHNEFKSPPSGRRFYLPRGISSLLCHQLSALWTERNCNLQPVVKVKGIFLVISDDINCF